MRRPGDDFGAGLRRVPGGVFQKQNFCLADAFPCTTKVAGLESDQICRKQNATDPLISGPHERSPRRQPLPSETKEHAARPPRRRPGGFRLPPIRCKNCAKFLRLLCRPNNMSPLASHLFSVRPPFARRTTVEEDDDGRTADDGTAAVQMVKKSSKGKSARGRPVIRAEERRTGGRVLQE